MSRNMELPDHTYEALLRAATEQGVSPAEWIAAALAGPEMETVHARTRRHRASGNGAPVNNTEVDADLIREYEARFGHSQINGVPRLL